MYWTPLYVNKHQ